MQVYCVDSQVQVLLVGRKVTNIPTNEITNTRIHILPSPFKSDIFNGYMDIIHMDIIHIKCIIDLNPGQSFHLFMRVEDSEICGL